jgi:hypothetical protein
MFERKERCWCDRRDSNSRTSGSKSFDLLCQILPEEWLVDRIQQVGANSRSKPLSRSFVVIYHGIAVVFRALRDIFVTDTSSAELRRQGSNEAC